MNFSKKRVLALILAACMFLALLPGMVFSGGADPVRIRRSDGTYTAYASLESAVTAANKAGGGDIEIVGDIDTPNSVVSISSKIRITGAEGPHSVKNFVFDIINNGNLILGDGTNDNVLTITGQINALDVKNAFLTLNDGFIFQNSFANTDAIALRGKNVRGTVTGGTIIADGVALRIENGAQIDEISGGVFLGKQASVFMGNTSSPLTNANASKIGKISGGVYKSEMTGFGDACLSLESNSIIGEISGGSFNSIAQPALFIARGSRVEKISGGEFKAERLVDCGAVTTYNPTSITVRVTGIGAITGGHFENGRAQSGTAGGIGFWLKANTEIDKIEGGTFAGNVGLATEYDSYIASITGGVFLASTNNSAVKAHGIHNNGVIMSLSNVKIISDQFGISNVYDSVNITTGSIPNVDGIYIDCTGPDGQDAINNQGRLPILRNSTILSNGNGINNYSGSRIEEITNCIIYGKTNTSIYSVSNIKTQLEPGLASDYGFSRYASDKTILYEKNKDYLVLPSGYHMSAHTLPVAGIDGVEFRYLTKYFNLKYNSNGGYSDGPADEKLENSPDKSISLNSVKKPTHAGDGGIPVVFIGWSAVKTDKIYGADDVSPNVVKTVANTNRDAEVFAVWGYDADGNATPHILEKTYSVSYDLNGGVEGSGPETERNLIPDASHPLNTHDRPVHVDEGGNAVLFMGWTAEKDEKIYAKDDVAPHTVAHVDITDGDATVYAAWAYDTNGNRIPDLGENKYTLTYDVNGGKEDSGPAREIGLLPGVNRTLNYAEPPLHTSAGGVGVVFAGWLDNPDSHIYEKNDVMATTCLESVHIEEEDVTVYAVWGYDENGNETPDFLENKYTLTYDANGGVNAPAPAEGLLPGTNVRLDGAVIPARTAADGNDMIFAGWSAERFDAVFNADNPAPAGIESIEISDCDLIVYALWDYTPESAVTEEGKTDGGGDGEGKEKPPVTEEEDKAGGGDDVTGEGKTDGGTGGESTGGTESGNDGGTGGGTDVGTGGESTGGTEGGATGDKENDPPVTPPETGGDKTGGDGGNTGNNSSPGGKDSASRQPEHGEKPTDTASAGSEYTHISPPQDIEKGHILVPNGGGGYWDIDRDGKITGVWTYDSISGKWRFDADIPLAGLLFTDDHIWYMRGYADNTIHPDSPITRAEVAMVFYRLLNPDLKVKITHSTFADVSVDDWHGEAVNTLAYHGLVYGYPDGAFRPEQPISRAEISAIVSRFEKLARTDSNPYADVGAEHWAYNYILSATEKGWFMGDESGCFRPGDDSTRSEFVAVVNRILGRKILLFNIPEGVHTFADLPSGHWAYADIMEAVYSHDISRIDGDPDEKWSKMTGSGLDAEYNQ